MSAHIGNKRDFDELERRRMQAASLLNRGLCQAEVARRVKVSRESVRRWSNQIQEHGKKALKKADRTGRKPRLGPTELDQLENILRAGPEKAGFRSGLWTLDRIAQLIRQQFEVDFHPAHVWWLLQKKLRWSCQRPVARARERNEAAVREWKESTWPALKKNPKKRVAASSR